MGDLTCDLPPLPSPPPQGEGAMHGVTYIDTQTLGEFYATALLIPHLQ